MNKSLIVTLAVLGVFLGRELVQPAAAAPDGQRKILIVQLRRIVDESKEGREIVGKVRAQIAKKKEQIAGEVKLLQEQVNVLMKAQLPDRDAAWYGDIKKALDKQGTLKAQEQYFVAKLNDDIARKLNNLMRGCHQEAREVMKAIGADLVVVSRMGGIQINSDKDLQDEIMFRRVLCARDGLDITNEVLKRMDKFFEDNR